MGLLGVGKVLIFVYFCDLFRDFGDPGSRQSRNFLIAPRNEQTGFG